jgi:hypothetical protein
MKQEIPLKRFEYCIADPGAIGIGGNVDVDFEKSTLRLAGERLKVKATIYPGFGVDLSDETNDGLVFSLDGILEDGKTINSCSGLLVLHSATDRKGRSGSEWRLSVYLYDNNNDEREIILNLTMGPVSGNAGLN